MGVPEHLYHLGAVSMGSVAGAMTIVGLVGLLYRRFVIGSVRAATTLNDKIMYVLLLLPIGLGAYATVTTQLFGPHGGYDYRETVSPWLRSIFLLQPKPELMVDVPMSFKLHVIAGLLLFAIWPFTRLVHVVSAPVGYVNRPYVIYRSRKPAIQADPVRRGWQPVHTQGTGNASKPGFAAEAPSQGA